EADRHPIDAGGVASVRGYLGVDDGFVGGQARDADPIAFEIAWPAHWAIAAGDHGGKGALHDRHRTDHVEAALTGDSQVVDIEDREIGTSSLEQLRRIGRFARLADR